MTKTASPPWVHELAPYVPGKPIDTLRREYGVSDIIKLASNENPYGPSPAAVQAMADAAASVHLYPDPATHALRAALAESLQVDADRVLVGNGSNELITLLVRAFTTPENNVVAGQYGFIAYRIVAGAAGVPVRAVPEPTYTSDVDGMIAACDDDTRLLFVANPNNPTGTFVGYDEVERLLQGVPEHVLVVLDEAYVEYVTDPDCPNGLDLLDRRENLVVMRTFSKAYGLAGCRVGYAVAPPYVAERINRVREPFNVNRLGQIGATAALGDTDFIDRTTALNAAARKRLSARLVELGIEPLPSQTNFVLFESPVAGAEVNESLLRQGVIVRPMAPYGLPNHIRVTVGTDDETERFLNALQVALTQEMP